MARRIYHYQPPPFLVQAAAHGATGGFLWIGLAAPSLLAVAVRRLSVATQLGSPLLAPSSPRLQFERMTFTGAAPGTPITPARTRTSDGAPLGLVVGVTAPGGVLTAGAAIWATMPAAAASAASYNPVYHAEFAPHDAARPVLVAGEGIVFRQPDAGTAADTRRIVVELVLDEYDLASQIPDGDRTYWAPTP